jgi:tetratricopeptide (TPR) repeat protein
MATISEALAIAIEHHQAGRLQAAEQIYRQILAVQPNHADAWHLLGFLAHQVGRHEVAVEYIQRAVDFNGAEATFHNNLGEAYRALRRVPEAIGCYRRALELNPDFAEAHSNLGIACRNCGKLDDAIACYRRALELKPDFAKTYNNLGNALKEQGKLDEAIACYRRAVELMPDLAEIHNNLGNAFKDQGKLDEAIDCYHRALELKPGYAEAHNNLGAALKDQGKLDEAIARHRRALELNPRFAEAFYNLGNALKEQGKLDEATTCYHRAVELKPDFAEAHNNLGNTLETQAKLAEAIACYRRVLELKPEYAEAHNNLGNALESQGNLDDAFVCYRRALELKPDFAEAHTNLGGAFEELGDLQSAEDRFRTALRHNGRFALAHYKLAKLAGGKLPQEDLAAQRRLLEEKDLTDAQRLLLHFGLAQVLDARREYAEAAQHLERANALQRSEWRKCGQQYDPNEYEFLVTQMISICTAEFFEGVRGFGVDSELPVFVVGLPRSGTTLIEQILASHSQVFGAGEISLAHDSMTALGGQGVEFIGGLRRLDLPTSRWLASRHLEKLRALSRDALRIVDKMPDNYLYLGLLASLFPRAKLIHCRRDPRDVAVSCWMTHFKDIHWASDQQQIASRFHEYRRLMAHWRKVLPVPLLEVDYEETVADLEGVARKVVDWCGLAWEPACLEFQQAKRAVRTASAVQVRQPVFKTSVERWRNYEHALAPLFARLEEEGKRDEG